VRPDQFPRSQTIPLDTGFEDQRRFIVFAWFLGIALIQQRSSVDLQLLRVDDGDTTSTKRIGYRRKKQWSYML